MSDTIKPKFNLLLCIQINSLLNILKNTKVKHLLSIKTK